MKVELTHVNKQLIACGLHPEAPYLGVHNIIGVYHAHEWDHGYCEYGEKEDEFMHRYNGTCRGFYADLSEMASFLNQYFKDRAIIEFIAAPFHNHNQFKYIDDDYDIYREIKRFLMHYDISDNSQAGIRLSVNEKEVIEMLLEGAFRGVSLLGLFFPEANVLISPNHHFGIPFFTQNPNSEKEAIELLLKDFPNLKFYEKSTGIED